MTEAMATFGAGALRASSSSWMPGLDVMAALLRLNREMDVDPRLRICEDGGQLPAMPPGIMDGHCRTGASVIVRSRTHRTLTPAHDALKHIGYCQADPQLVSHATKFSGSRPHGLSGHP